MSESTNIPIPCTPNNDSISAKTNSIFYFGILANKQNKNHVHLNDTKPLKDDLQINHAFRKTANMGNLPECQKPYTQ